MANKRYFNGCKADGDVMSRLYEMLSAVKVDEWGALVRQAKLAWDKCKDTRATKDGKLYTKANSVTADEMVAVIARLKCIDGITVNIVGDWVRVTDKSGSLYNVLWDLGCRQKKGSKTDYYWNPELYANIKAYYARKAESAANAKAK